MTRSYTIEHDEFGLAVFRSEYATTAERKQEGKEKRKEILRESHGEYDPKRERTDPVTVIKKSSKGRWEHLVPIRYGRMAKAHLHSSAARHP